jgi:hypothetical protein
MIAYHGRMAGQSEGRRAPRVSVSHEVVLEYGGYTMRVSAMDLSHRGLSVWAAGKAPQTPLRITMAINDRPVILKGRVARQFESDGGAVWGIEFADAEGDDQENLQIVSEYVDGLV